MAQALFSQNAWPAWKNCRDRSILGLFPPEVEHEYKRRGARAYLAAWDAQRAKVFGRCEAKSGIAPFDRLVDQVVQQSPYREARRVFWIADNGASQSRPEVGPALAKPPSCFLT